MGSILDMFMPGASSYLTPDQQDAVSNRGMLNAGLGLIDASSNHYGLPMSTLQILAQGVRGYGQGVGDYSSAIMQNAQAQQELAKSQMGQIQTQRALQHFYPQGKGNGMAAALSPGQPQSYAPQDGGLSSFYGAASPSQPIPPVAGAAVGAGYGQPSGGTFPPSPSSPASGGAQTAFGTDVPTMARQLYSQGIDQMYSGLPGGDVLIKQAIEMDPSIIASSESAKAGADYPFEIGKIGATGAQARQTETLKAGQTPYTQTVMMNGQPTQIATNNLAAATGGYPMPQQKPDMPMPMPGQKPRVPPPGAGAFGATTTAPMGAGAGNVPLGTIPQVSASALRPPEISTNVPVGAQQKAEALAKDAAENTMSTQDVTNKANDMRTNLQAMIDEAKRAAKLTGAGTPSTANSRVWLENHVPAMNKSLNDTYAKLDALGSGTLLPSIKEYLQGTGQVRVFEGQNLQKMFEFDPDIPLSANIAKWEQALPQIDRMEQGAHRRLQASQTGQVQPASNAAPVINVPGWSIKRVK